MFRAILMLFLFTIFIVGNSGCGNQNLTLATGNQMSSFQAVGNSIAKIVSQDSKDLDVTAIESGGSVDNIDLLKDRKVNLALVQNDIAFYAVNGIEMFKGNSIQNLRGIATLYPLTCHMVTLASSGITDFESLRGKRVSIGGAGRADEINIRQILGEYDITYDDFEVFNLLQGEALDALKAGQIDAAFFTTFMPAPFITEFASQNPIRIIPIGDAQITSLTAKYPYYTRIDIPAQSYPGLETGAPTVAVRAMLVSTNQLRDEDAYEIARAIFLNTDRLDSTHDAVKMIKKDSARSGMSIQMQDGAARFFNE